METAFITNRGEVVMIRSARPEDAEGIVDSVNQVGREKIHLLVEEFPLSVEEERQYLLELDRDRNLFLVVVSGGMATGEGRIVGGVGVFQDRGGAQSQDPAPLQRRPASNSGLPGARHRHAPPGAGGGMGPPTGLP